jgi:hypothetical protein
MALVAYARVSTEDHCRAVVQAASGTLVRRLAECDRLKTSNLIQP